MFVSDNLGVNASGNLTIGGVDTVALAKKYGLQNIPEKHRHIL